MLFLVDLESFTRIEMVDYIERELFLEYKVKRKDLLAGITRKGSYNFSFHIISSEEEKLFVKSSRKKLLKETGFKEIVSLKQTHSDIIKFVDSSNLSEFVNNPYIIGDGLVTNVKQILIAVSTADCVPIMFISEGESLCGIVHAGWRGVSSKIHLKMLDNFKKYGVSFDSMEIIIGPHNRKCCYDVKNDMFNYFDEKYFLRREENLFLNLEDVIRDDFINKGITNIYSVNLCSSCNNDLLYSYRKGDGKGRNLSFIGLT